MPLMGTLIALLAFAVTHRVEVASQGLDTILTARLVFTLRGGAVELGAHGLASRLRVDVAATSQVLDERFSTDGGRLTAECLVLRKHRPDAPARDGGCFWRIASAR
jgi:hypothetical protein